jgi:two-component system KDP operon response regulator KdpE
VVSSDESLLRSLRDFEAELVGEPSRNGHDPSAGADVVLLDLRDAGRQRLIPEYARRGRAVLALGRGDRGEEILRCLDAGADDYVRLTATPVELAARIRSIARRAASVAAARPQSVFEDDPEPETPRPGDPLALTDYRFDELTILTGRHEVWQGDHQVELTPTEFALLVALAGHPNEVVSHHRLTAAIWGAEGLSSRRHLRVHVRHLREKLESDPSSPTLVLTEKGRGYRLAVTEVEAA